MSTTKVDALRVVADMCDAYAAAVNAGDSRAYGALFEADAIRMPPQSAPERGRGAIISGEQAAYDDAIWNIRSTPEDALQLTDEWVYGIASVDAVVTPHDGRPVTEIQATKTWLLHLQATGRWSIARQMWNVRRVRSEVGERAGPAPTEVHRTMVRAAMARDFDALRVLYADDYVYRAADGAELRGPDGAVDLVRAFTTAFPDYDVEIVRQFAAGSEASVIEFRATGTHRAEFDGAPPTGRRIDYLGVNISEFENGKIVREREYYDNAVIRRQLGLE